jgi:hypothetical protein
MSRLSSDAANAANYFVNGGAVSVTNATLRYDGQTVLLGLNGRVTNGFRVAVSNVLDITGRNVISPGSSATGNVAGLTPIDIGTAGDPVAPWLVLRVPRRRVRIDWRRFGCLGQCRSRTLRLSIDHRQL